MRSVLDRFLRYVTYDTQSREGASTYPSTPGQLVLLNDLVAELRAMGEDPTRHDLAWKHGIDAEILDPHLRLTEIRNFITHYVKPSKSARGRS